MADNSLKVSSLAPKYDHNRITNARFIQGGYFVVEKYEDLFSEDIGLTAASGVYDDDGAIVVGSLCYCQKEGTHYMCTNIDRYGNITWDVVDIDVVGTTITSGETETPTEYLDFNSLNDGTWEVSGKKDKSDPTGCKTIDDDKYKNVVIPSTYEGKPVTQIASHAFDSCSKLETVKIPNTITFIREKAFHQCTSLKYVEIPDSVIDIGSDGGAVFEYCSNLEWASIPKSVKTLAVFAFHGCTKATLYCGPASRPEGWQENASYSWNPSGCPVVWNTYIETIKHRTTISVYGSRYTTSKGLWLRRSLVDDVYMVLGMGECIDKDLVIPPTYNGKPITSISSRAFENCTSIETAVIGQNVTAIGSYAFKGCTNLKKVTILDGVISIGRSMGEVFANCSSLKTVSIPQSVTHMGVHMFKGCKNAVIICEAVTQPSGWLDTNLSGCTVVRGVKLDLTVDISEVMSLSARLAAIETRCTTLETQQKTNASNIQENAEALLTLVTLLANRINELKNLKAEMETLGCKFIYNG